MFLVSLAVCPCFNFQKKTWHPAPCLSGSQTPQGRPATATVSSWEKLTLDAPIRGRPSVLAPFLPLPASVCVCTHLLSGFLSSPVPPSSSVPILQLSQRLAGFGPGFGGGSCLLISTGLTAPSHDGEGSSVLGTRGIGNDS